jgi:hypothetical protein
LTNDLPKGGKMRVRLLMAAALAVAAVASAAEKKPLTVDDM